MIIQWFITSSNYGLRYIALVKTLKEINTSGIAKEKDYSGAIAAPQKLKFVYTTFC